MFHINIKFINVPDGQKGLYYYEIIIKYDNVVMSIKYHTSFTKANDTVEDTVRIATNYNSRDGIFQENLLKHALSKSKVTYTYIVDSETNYNDCHGKLTII